MMMSGDDDEASEMLQARVGLAVTPRVVMTFRSLFGLITI